MQPNPPVRLGRGSARRGAHDADIAAVETHLQEFLGMVIRIKTEADPRKGTITIQYRTLDQLDLLCQRLTGGDL
jgi:ParB family chromosome partitioning protein